MSIGGFSPLLPSAAQDVKTHERKVDSEQKAAKAQGVEGDDKESAATAEDRDADGRQSWRWQGRRAQHQEEGGGHRAPDITGQAGSQLDLSG